MPLQSQGQNQGKARRRWCEDLWLGGGIVDILRSVIGRHAARIEAVARNACLPKARESSKVWFWRSSLFRCTMVVPLLFCRSHRLLATSHLLPVPAWSKHAAASLPVRYPEWLSITRPTLVREAVDMAPLSQPAAQRHHQLFPEGQLPFATLATWQWAPQDRIAGWCY